MEIKEEKGRENEERTEEKNLVMMFYICGMKENIERLLNRKLFQILNLRSLLFDYNMYYYYMKGFKN